MEKVLTLFAETEIFVFVFMEVVTRINIFQRVMIKKANWRDITIFVLVFGGFSILGTYLGIPLPSGAIVNIRDFAPMIAGLTAGPILGLVVGLIGGIHRLFLGGFTCIPCALATIFAGPICGAIYHFNKRKLVGIFQGMGIAVIVEFLHGALTLLIARPFAEALDVVKTAIPAMMVANSLGIAIGIIILSHTKELKEGA
jgi:sigma-B regulation protein RsbU (phosphoserine phosphatase)